MPELEEIERELREYLAKEPNLRRDDRLSYLMTIFTKRLEFNRLDHVVNHADYFKIFQEAKSIYTTLKTPVRLSKKELSAPESVQMATLESFIYYLNRNNLLKKLIKFDITDNKAD